MAEPVANVEDNARFNLDGPLAKFGELVQAERACNWAAGEVIAAAVAGMTKKKRREAFGAFAEAGHCTVARIGQLHDVFLAYTPIERQRCRGITWALARAIMQAAHRAGEPVSYVLSIAFAENWHLPQAAAYAPRFRKRAFRMSETCERCAHTVTVRGALKGLALPCPVCIVTQWLDGGDGKSLPRLGALC